MKTIKNRHQLRLDQRAYYTTAVRATNQPSVRYLETLAKIMDFPANSRYLLKALIRSCLFLLDTKLLKFLKGILVRENK